MPQHPTVNVQSTRALVQPFPTGGPRIQIAYLELLRASEGSPSYREVLGDPALLPRPWDPSTCADPDLRLQVWEWLDDVVAWLNEEHTWDPRDMIPTCWPQHPHLVHELAVLADQRRQAAFAVTSDELETWHRYALPAFADRCLSRIRELCEGGHQPWPGGSRHVRQQSAADRLDRRACFESDLDATGNPAASMTNPGRPSTQRLVLVDLHTGEMSPGTADS